MFGYIYKYRNVITNKVYIGQTTNLYNRKTSHKSKSLHVKNKFYNSVRKHGWNAFEYSIIATIEASNTEQCTLLLDYLEEIFIKHYDSFNHGYNSTPGGHSARGMKRSSDYIEYCKNRTYSEDTRNKMREAAKNRKISEETREKFRQNAIKRNFLQYRKAAEAKRNAAIKKALAKPIIQLDVEGSLVNTFDSGIDTARYIQANLAPHLTIRGIIRTLNRRLKNKSRKKLYYGFIWKYKINV